MIRADDRKTAQWPGGTTTELAIYPENAEYAERNFIWRISTATMEAEQTSYTHLPGYWRLLMATAGEFDLEHLDRHTSKLKPFEKDSFSGDWTTRCFGTGEDLNVMLAPGYGGELKAVPIEEYTCETLQYETALRNTDIFECIYCVDGEINISMDEHAATLLKPGDLLVYSKRNDALLSHIHYTNAVYPLVETVHAIRITIYKE
ncbi:HutD family protein [Paenibacillus sp. 7124]|uniref:HutD family protein n=1 Tax=Paenibacillus apii TaxID=1850370 RepID=A0A6M1PKE0_9BACL|nr:HutD family protein [Paenibacillus apii]NGM82433.1 HutD family protein [Paenibacillus apii]NJJ39570.1 HutD family protein [Paenibacillus apii]